MGDAGDPRGPQFYPWSGKIPYATGQISLCSTTRDATAVRNLQPGKVCTQQQRPSTAKNKLITTFKKESTRTLGENLGDSRGALLRKAASPVPLRAQQSVLCVKTVIYDSARKQIRRVRFWRTLGNILTNLLYLQFSFLVCINMIFLEELLISIQQTFQVLGKHCSITYQAAFFLGNT